MFCPEDGTEIKAISATPSLVSYPPCSNCLIDGPVQRHSILRMVDCYSKAKVNS